MISVISYMLCGNLIQIGECVQKLFRMQLLISGFWLHCNLFMVFGFGPCFSGGKS